MTSSIFVHKSLLINACPDLARIMQLEPKKVELYLDSRKINKAGGIFFAIKGENFDGHDFVESALKNGADLAVVKEDFKTKAGIDKLLRVKNPLQLFSDLAQMHILKMPATRIAITGSNGKTTTKEMLKAALNELCDIKDSRVFASFANQNNHVGLPQNAFLLNENHQFAIFEMGMNHAQEINHLCKIAQPQIGLITNIGHAHEGNFPDGILGVQKAKGELFAFLAQNGHAVMNLDDERITEEGHKHRFKNSTTFGEKAEAELRLIKVEQDSTTNFCQLITVFSQKSGTFSFRLNQLGSHNAKNAVAALAVVHALELDIKKAALGFKKMPKTLGRLELMRNSFGATILNDAYNANPDSLKAGLNTVKEIFAKRKIAIIGDMGELGEFSAFHHANLGENLAKIFGLIFLVGKNTKYSLQSALENGFSPKNIFHFKNNEELLYEVKKILEPNDLIFIKGSHSAKLESLAQALASL